jgi:hypothetical protein
MAALYYEHHSDHRIKKQSEQIATAYNQQASDQRNMQARAWAI